MAGHVPVRIHGGRGRILWAASPSVLPLRHPPAHTPQSAPMQQCAKRPGGDAKQPPHRQSQDCGRPCSGAVGRPSVMRAQSDFKDTLAERLRRRSAKPMGSPRVGSNLPGVSDGRRQTTEKETRYDGLLLLTYLQSNTNNDHTCQICWAPASTRPSERSTCLESE